MEHGSSTRPEGAGSPEGEALAGVLWTPSAERVARANITRFQQFLRATRGIDLDGYDSLWEWSVTELEDFWAAVWEFFDLGDVSDYDTVLDGSMPGAA